jgi:AraC-like DNA-binding protein
MRHPLIGFHFSLLHIDYVRLTTKWNYANVMSPYYRIYYIDHGEGYIKTKQEKIKLEPGFLYLIPSFTLCNFWCDSTLGQYFLHFLEESPEGISLFEHARKIMKLSASPTDIQYMKRLLTLNPGRGINRSDNPKEYEKQVFFKDYQVLNETMRDSVFLETQGMILLLLSKFLNARKIKTKTPVVIPSKITEVVRYIQMNLHETLTVHHLANLVNLHQDYFSRLFLRHVSQRPLRFIQEKRIERAQYLITTTDLSFLEIAEHVGFEDLSHFSKTFKKITSITPGDYKKQNLLR